MQLISYRSEYENKQSEIPKMLPGNWRGASSALMSSSLSASAGFEVANGARENRTVQTQQHFT